MIYILADITTRTKWFYDGKALVQSLPDAKVYLTKESAENECKKLKKRFQHIEVLYNKQLKVRG